MRRSWVAMLLSPALYALAAPAPGLAADPPCDAGGQSAFAVELSYKSVAVGRAELVAVLSPDGLTDRSGDWQRDNAATVTLDDPGAAKVARGSEDVDALVTPTRTGTVGVTVGWTQVSQQTGETCARSDHVTFEAVTGKPPGATVFGRKTGDYELNEIAAGIRLKGGCSLDNSGFAIVPVTWTLHWTTNGSAPTRRSHTLEWSSPDPCAHPNEGQRLLGPKRVANRTFVANRAGYAGYETISVIPAFKSRGMRGWWEVSEGGKLVKSTRFRYVYGSGFRTVQGHRFPITGSRLEHDSGPCPGLRCTPWAPLPSLLSP